MTHPELFASWADWLSFSAWLDSKPPLAAHPALRKLIREEQDLFVGWRPDDWFLLALRFEEQWPFCQCGELDLLYLLAVKLAAEVAGRA